MLHRNHVYTHNNGRDRCDGMTVVRNNIYKRQQKEAMQKNASAHRAARFAPLVDFAKKVLPLLGTAEGLSALADRPDEEQLAYGKQLFAAVAPALDAFQKERAARWKRAHESVKQAVVAKKTYRLNRLRSRLRVMQCNKDVRQVAAANNSCQHRISPKYYTARLSGASALSAPALGVSNGGVYSATLGNSAGVIPVHLGTYVATASAVTASSKSKVTPKTTSTKSDDASYSPTMPNTEIDETLQKEWLKCDKLNNDLFKPFVNLYDNKSSLEAKKLMQRGRHRVYTLKHTEDEKDSPFDSDYVWEDYIFDTGTNKFRKATEAEKEIECCGIISADVVNYANNPLDTEPAAVSASEQFSVRFASAVEGTFNAKKSKRDLEMLPAQIDAKHEVSETQIKSVFEKLFGETFPEIKARLLQKEKKDEIAEEEATPAAKYAWAATTLKSTAVSMAVFAVFKGASIVFSSYILSSQA